jgi:ribosomal protein L11 methyltransferase
MDIRRIVTVPLWDQREEREGELLLRINVGRSGGLAFGFGSHPTTSLALGFVGGLYAQGTARPRRVLDVGCGTGVLAIACARLGAEEVLGVDIDAAAVGVSAENAERNGVADRCRFATTPASEVPGSFDLVVANLPSAAILRELCPALCARAHGGLLILSGFQEGTYRESVLADFTAAGRALRREARQPPWCSFLL